MITPNFFIRDNTFANEVRRITKETPNDMELGKAIRKIITDAEDELKRNQFEEIRKTIIDDYKKGH